MEKSNLVKGLALGLMISLMTVANATEKNAPAEAPRQFSAPRTEWFHTAKVNVPAKVQFVRSHGFSVTVKADDTEVAKGVKYSINKGILNVSMDKSMSDASLAAGNVTIIIASPMPPKMTTNKNYTIE